MSVMSLTCCAAQLLPGARLPSPESCPRVRTCPISTLPGRTSPGTTPTAGSRRPSPAAAHRSERIIASEATPIPSSVLCLRLSEQVPVREWTEGQCTRGRSDMLVGAGPLCFLVTSWGLDFGGAGTVSTWPVVGSNLLSPEAGWVIFSQSLPALS